MICHISVNSTIASIDNKPECDVRQPRKDMWVHSGGIPGNNMMATSVEVYIYL